VPAPHSRLKLPDTMAVKTAAQQADEERLQIEDLQTAAARRHLLTRGTADYAAAIEVEERLAARIWRRVRAAARAPLAEPASGSQAASREPLTFQGGRRSRPRAGTD